MRINKNKPVHFLWAGLFFVLSSLKTDLIDFRKNCSNNEGTWYPPDTLSEMMRITYDYKTQKFRCSLDSSTDPKDPQKSTFGSISVAKAKKLLKSWKVSVD